MKKSKMMLGTSMLLAVLLIAGGTFAWFTAKADDVVNEFKAGTVIMTVEENFNECEAQNVNPGDTIEKEVLFCNDGTKRMFVRAKLTPEFAEQLTAEGVVSYEIGEGWILDDDGFYYYEESVCPGECTPHLITEVEFDGEAMNNDYQGAEFTLTIESEAIQATNGAAEAVWGAGIPNMTLLECND